MTRSITRQNSSCQPTNASVLSVCANTTAMSACAAKYGANLTDTALAVSVFAFALLLATVIGHFCIPLIVISAAAFVYRLYTICRLRYGIRLFVKDYEKQNIPCTFRCVVSAR
jgi:hypothetical protein